MGDILVAKTGVFFCCLCIAYVGILEVMDLKECIVVVNECSVKTASSPDNRVSDYISWCMKDSVAFDTDTVGVDNNELDKNANEIQKLFDNGSPVSTMTISFANDYLKENGLSRDNMDDQLALCRAIKHGLGSMNFMGDDDLQYVGSIHADTVSVYCRVVMVNAGEGKLSQEMQHDLRYGIDDYLG